MTRQELLAECLEIVTKHRQSQYGTPEDNFARIGQMWSTYLGVDIKNYDVANMMILLKVVRSQNKPGHSDSWIDMAGYAACGCEVATKQEVDKPKKSVTVGESKPVLDEKHVWCDGPLTQCIKCGAFAGQPSGSKLCDPSNLEGKKQYCCDCGDEYPESDLIAGYIYCGVCRLKDQNA